DDGLATEAGKPTFWDRATLYALRGVLAAGETFRAMPFLSHYANRRLLGEHVPYPVEAWPEGNQRHLSAESALFCRVITEGLWGIRPEGLLAFSCTPRLPEGWERMSLHRVHLQGQLLDLKVDRMGDRIRLTVTRDQQILVDEVLPAGSTFRITD
ncbi:MAG TPA: glycosyl hydrolase family 65 protein, partial [Saprospiraceae bacterium]|nr:glycosyl hydrolase family 65 protein [Saprospiraceae bacterium]